jgi:hypothetical protein
VPDDYKNTSGLVVRSWKIVVKGYSNYEQRKKLLPWQAIQQLFFSMS